MPKFLRMCVALLPIVGGLLGLFVIQPAAAEGQGTVGIDLVVRQPIQVFGHINLVFGAVEKPDSGTCNMLITHDNIVSGSCELSPGAGTPSHGQVRVVAEPDVEVNAVVESPVDLTSPSGTISVQMQTAPGPLQVPGTGELFVNVGGEVEIDAVSSVAGTYSGVATVTIAY